MPHASLINVFDWWNALYALPLVVSGLLLVLSSLRLGGHGHHGAAHGHAHGHASHAGHDHIHAGSVHPAPVHRGPVANAAAHTAAARHAAGRMAREGIEAVNAASAPLPPTAEQPPLVAMLQSVFGIGRAPLLMVAELFFICWGTVGLIANELIGEKLHQGPALLLASAPIAFIGGLLLARIGAAILDKAVPQEESLVTSRDGLFGLTGEITFPVGSTGGRIHVYDAYGTLHDEACRTLPNSSPIPKGATAMVEDIDSAGNLIVREIAG